VSASAWDTPLTKVLKGSEQFGKLLGLHTVEDLLRHYPRRYQRRGAFTDLGSLEVGDHVTVAAEVSSAVIKEYQARNRGSAPRGGMGRRLDVSITDGTGTLQLVFFNTTFPARVLKPGVRGLFAGKVTEFRSVRQLAHPEYELFGTIEEAEAAAVETGPRALYRAASGLPSWNIARAVETLMAMTVDDLEDPLPEAIRVRHGFLALADALRAIHNPASDEQLEAAIDRLRYEEAFLLQTMLAKRRFEATGERATARPGTADGVLAAFDRRLPFALTRGQIEVGQQISQDVSAVHPMHRLLQGEVGSGKTIVALRAMLQVIDSGGQAALLAPTEVLAVQHFRSLTAMLGELAEGGSLLAADVGTSLALLTGSQNTAARRAALLAAASGAAGIVVGTHALLEDKVQFADLGLVVVDEQHRFGVDQRAALADKAPDGTRPHVLVMSATPIPRTVAITLFGDLDVSALTELPLGRSPITTHLIDARKNPSHLDRAWARIGEEVAKGHKAYIVCPRISADDKPEKTSADADESARRPPLAAEEVHERLTAMGGPLAGVRIGLLHGRMHPDDKDAVMRRFAAPQADSDALDLIVATTVIEVGVDVPSATVMLVMDADRFGISQLHQLRGRVGRGSAAGLCLLHTEFAFGPTLDRLSAVAASSDGFELARLDLEGRGEGDVLGTNQSGARSSLRLLSVLNDGDVIEDARIAAIDLVAADPQLADHPALAEAIDRFSDERREYLDRG